MHSSVFWSTRSYRFAQFIMTKFVVCAGLRNLCRLSSLCSLYWSTEDRLCSDSLAWSDLYTNCIKPPKPSSPICLRFISL